MGESVMNEPSSSGLKSRTLLNLACRGDREAASALFARYQRRLLWLVRREMPGALRDRLETMDIVQETLATAYRKLAEFEPEGDGSLHAWLRRIADLKIKEAIRFHAAGKRAAATDPLPSVVPGISDAHLGTRLDQQAAMAELESELDALPNAQREALELWYLEGLAPAEMAKRLDRTADACRMLVARALTTLGRHRRREPAP
jgi:RNA polymerase sigma-70 factor (ECF subfamily)